MSLDGGNGGLPPDLPLCEIPHVHVIQNWYSLCFYSFILIERKCTHAGTPARPHMKYSRKTIDNRAKTPCFAAETLPESARAAWNLWRRSLCDFARSAQISPFAAGAAAPSFLLLCRSRMTKTSK